MFGIHELFITLLLSQALFYWGLAFLIKSIDKIDNTGDWGKIQHANRQKYLFLQYCNLLFFAYNYVYYIRRAKI